MSPRARALQTLYRRGKVTIEGLRRAVEDETITAQEFEMITGIPYKA